MTATLIIPLRGLRHGKTRLAGVLKPAARADLVAAMLAHVVGTAKEAPVITGIAVVSADRAALDLAESLGARALGDPPGGTINAALSHAVASLPVNSDVMVLPADLPRLAPDDVTALVEAGKGGVALAPDRAGTGTNGMFLAEKARAMSFRFGADSFAAHTAGAQALGFAPAIVDRPGLAFDLDAPGDYADWITPPR